MNEGNLTIRLPTDLNDKLKHYAFQQGIAKSMAVREAIQSMVEGNIDFPLPKKLILKVQYISVLMQQPYNEEAWQLIKKEVELLCEMTKKDDSL